MGDRCGTAHGNRYDPTGPVFISYRQSDGTEHAKCLDRFLRAGGLVPWRDLVDLPPGETARRVHEAFEEGIAAAVLFMAGSGFLLFLAQKEIPMGTAYAVWTGIGAAGTFLVGVLFFNDAATLGRWLGAALIISGVAVMKLSSGR